VISLRIWLGLDEDETSPVPSPGPAQLARNARRQAFMALMTAVRAADRQGEYAQRGAVELLTSPRQSATELNHQLELPLQVLLRFHEGPARALPVDVLEYGENGRKLTVSLPPDLPVSRGQWGEIHLMDAKGYGCPLPTAHAAPQFSVVAVEPGRRVTLAVLAIEPQG
jgi:hypothetical protein